jgi:hypothetical protein
VFRRSQLGCDAPSRLINEQHGVGAGLRREAKRLKMRFHRLGVAKGQDEPTAVPSPAQMAPRI